jgi:hypothetical protein
VPSSSSAADRFLVGVHFQRHRGGPGHLTVAPGEIVLATRTRTVRQVAPVVRLTRKRLEPPWGNHWIEVTDGSVTGHAVTSRRRAEALLSAITAAGFTVDRP